MRPDQTQYRENAYEEGFNDAKAKSEADLRDQFAMAATDYDVDQIMPDTAGDICDFVGVKYEYQEAIAACTREIIIQARMKARYMIADAMLEARKK